MELMFPVPCRYLKEEWAYLNGGARPLDLPISERIWRNLPQRIEKKKITVELTFFILLTIRQKWFPFFKPCFLLMHCNVDWMEKTEKKRKKKLWSAEDGFHLEHIPSAGDEMVNLAADFYFARVNWGFRKKKKWSACSSLSTTHEAAFEHPRCSFF